jgi:hypothetical protein
MDTLTATTLAEVLHEPEKALLARVLKMLGQERCAAILADTLTQHDFHPRRLCMAQSRYLGYTQFSCRFYRQRITRIIDCMITQAYFACNTPKSSVITRVIRCTRIIHLAKKGQKVLEAVSNRKGQQIMQVCQSKSKCLQTYNLTATRRRLCV